MRSVGLETLGNQLGEYVRLAAGGEVILVTERDQVIAEIVPPQPGHELARDPMTYSKAVRRGWLTPPTSPSGAAPSRRPVASWQELELELARDRED